MIVGAWLCMDGHLTDLKNIKYSCLPEVKEKNTCMTESFDIFSHNKLQITFSNVKESVRNSEVQGKFVFTIYL
jgi:hypothetical protein